MAKGLPGKIRRYIAMKNRASRMFRDASALLTEIAPELQKKRDKRIRIAPKANAVLIDNFGDKITQYKNVGFDRFRIDIEEL